MLKREREESGWTGRSAGVKLQKTSEAPERSATEAMQTISQDMSGSGVTVNNFPARNKNVRQRSASVPRGNTPGYDGLLPQEHYKVGFQLGGSRHPRPDGEPDQVLVRISTEHISPGNRQIKDRQLWGVDTYTNDSDVVAMLIHCGYVAPSKGWSKSDALEIHATIEFCPPRQSYPTVFRHGMRSRSWGPLPDGQSIKVVKCMLYGKHGQENELHPVNNVEPTFMPTRYEKPIATRASSSHPDKRQKYCQEVNMLFSLTNEPWLRYSMQVIADKGLKPSQLTTARLYAEVLYFESPRVRYELSMENRPLPGVIPEVGKENTYKFAKFKNPKAYPVTRMTNLGIPLSEEDGKLEVIAKNLKWEEIQFDPKGVTIQGKLFQVDRLHFIPCSQKGAIGLKAESKPSQSFVPEKKQEVEGKEEALRNGEANKKEEQNKDWGKFL